jgi:hypothetical protein
VAISSDAEPKIAGDDLGRSRALGLGQRLNGRQRGDGSGQLRNPIQSGNGQNRRFLGIFAECNTPTGSRTPVFGLRTRRPGPLDDGGKAQRFLTGVWGESSGDNLPEAARLWLFAAALLDRTLSTLWWLALEQLTGDADSAERTANAKRCRRRQGYQDPETTP